MRCVLDGFFLFRRFFKFKFVKIGPLNCFLQIRVKSLDDITDEVVLHRVRFFFFQKAKPYSRKPVSFTLKVKSSFDVTTSLFGFFMFSFMYIFLNIYYLVFLK